MEKSHKCTLKFCFSISKLMYRNMTGKIVSFISLFCTVFFLFFPLVHTSCLLYKNLCPCILAVMLQTLEFQFLQHTTCCVYDIINKHTTTNNIYRFQLIQTAQPHVSTRILVIICLAYYIKNKN